MLFFFTSLMRRGAISFGTTLMLAAASMALARAPQSSPPYQHALIGQDETAGLPQIGEGPFLAENGMAINKMMAALSIRPSGDVDRDFVAMMVPQRQAAIEMAQAVLRHGRNEQLRLLARQIVLAQQQDIWALRSAVGDRPASTPPDMPQSGLESFTAGVGQEAGSLLRQSR
jgi:uncharacterized protein (DUF305 family)